MSQCEASDEENDPKADVREAIIQKTWSATDTDELSQELPPADRVSVVRRQASTNRLVGAVHRDSDLLRPRRHYRHLVPDGLQHGIDQRAGTCMPRSLRDHKDDAALVDKDVDDRQSSSTLRHTTLQHNTSRSVVHSRCTVPVRRDDRCSVGRLLCGLLRAALHTACQQRDQYWWLVDDVPEYCHTLLPVVPLRQADRRHRCW